MSNFVDLMFRTNVVIETSDDSIVLFYPGKNVKLYSIKFDINKSNIVAKIDVTDETFIGYDTYRKAFLTKNRNVIYYEESMIEKKLEKGQKTLKVIFTTKKNIQKLYEKKPDVLVYSRKIYEVTFDKVNKEDVDSIIDVDNFTIYTTEDAYEELLIELSEITVRNYSNVTTLSHIPEIMKKNMFMKFDDEDMRNYEEYDDNNDDDDDDNSYEEDDGYEDEDLTPYDDDDRENDY